MNKPDKDPDVFGNAIRNYFKNSDPEGIIVHSPDFDDDVIPVQYLFRSYSEMPPLEKKALSLCRGRVLDIGAGAGSHSLYLQNKKNLKVTAVDTSEGAIEICKKRGIIDAVNVSFEDLSEEKFDTLLLLMNGTGIIGKMKNLNQFFKKAKSLLHQKGQILIDSSDLIYLFEQDEDGGVWLDPSEGYYGEMQYSMSYKGETSAEFDWLYLDFNSLSLAAGANGLRCELIAEGEHYDYLAKISYPEKE